VGDKELEPFGIAGPSAASADSSTALRKPACLNQVPVFWDAVLADRVLAVTLAGLADQITRRQTEPVRPGPQPQ
jgi:hypothetical protein